MSRSGLLANAPLHDVAALIKTTFDTERVRTSRRHDVYPHAHTAHELLWGFDGQRTIATADATWSLPPTLALWIPAGVVHEGVVAAHSSYFCTFVHPERVAIDLRAPTPIAMTPVLRELLLHLHSAELRPATRHRLEHVAIELIEPVVSSALPLPMPIDDRARVVAVALTVDPSDRRSIDDWGRHVGAASRTLHRLFVRETGMSFGRWRAHARARAAIPLLAGGRSVAEVGRLTGYDTASAFVRAFKSVTGQSPRAYVADDAFTVARAARGEATMIETVID